MEQTADAASAQLPVSGSGVRSGSTSTASPDLSRRALGQFGENLAAKHLESLGCQIVERNWRHSQGELDLVVLDANCLVFVEVKTRSSWAFGAPAEAVGRTKLARLRRLAGIYLQENHPQVDAVRIDVIAITTGGPNRCLEHFKGVDR